MVERAKVKVGQHLDEFTLMLHLWNKHPKRVLADNTFLTP